MKTLTHFIFLMSVILSSCAGHDCAKSEIAFGFIGFTQAEADTMIARRFARDNGFGSAIDTFIYTPEIISYGLTGDTLEMTSGRGDRLFLSTSYDYEFFIPATGQVFQITDMVEEQKSKARSLSNTKELCVNPFVSYVINGQFVDASQSYSRIFLRK
ncbi:MAG: hypothetical protein EOO09_19470 [Chitinophagaceae bacterium]|nr:MAG: hypothetical protein EOO09_19470 [Chitinophagaceae bacterium]